MTMLTELLTLSDDLSFHSQIKKHLLNSHIKSIYNYLKPQMGGFIEETSVGISILSSEIVNNKDLNLKCGVFYIEKIGGCNCLDDPYAENGYCEIQLNLHENSIVIL